jgi:nucleoside-diphosphate-sugar epimerase
VKVLVTGSEGFVGVSLVPLLEAAGHSVTRLDSMLFEGCEARPIAGRATVLRRDIRTLSPADLEGFDGIVHLAALSNDPLSNLDEVVTHLINHRAAVELACMARSVGVARFVFSSTCAVYGTQADEMIDEGAVPNPITAYGVSKLRAETDIAALAGAEFHPVALRFGTAYGWSDMVRFDLVVNNLVAGARLDGQLNLTSDGRAWRPLVHVDDMALGLLAALEAEAPAVSGEVFNIGRTEDNWQIIELAREISRHVDGCAVHVVEGAVSDKRSYRVDCSKVTRLLPAFEPKWSVAAGIADLVGEVRHMDIAKLSRLNEGRIGHLLTLRQTGRLDGDMRLVSA